MVEDGYEDNGSSCGSTHVAGAAGAGDHKVLVCGCGGAGANVLRNVYNQRIPCVKTVALNTDSQRMDAVECDMRMLIGQEITLGRGCRCDEYVGKMCAQRHSEEFREMVRDADIVIIVAGLGGGTGGPVANEIAKVCRDTGIPTIGMLIFPFKHEGKVRMERAKAMYKSLQEHLDCIIKIYNEWLMEVAPRKPVGEAFNMISSAICLVIEMIAERIAMMSRREKPGEDSAFIESLMSNHVSVLTIYEGRGQEFSEECPDEPKLPYIPVGIDESDIVHVQITPGSNISPKTVSHITRQMKNMSPNVSVGLPSRSGKSSNDDESAVRIYSVKHEKKGGNGMKQSTLLDMIWHQWR